MGLFHTHNWKEIARTYAKPKKEYVYCHTGLGEWIYGSGHWEMTQGVTTILLECIDCQEIRKETMLGKEVK